MGGNGNYQSGTDNLSQNPVFLYDSCGTYTVQLVIIDANQCTDLITLPVDVYCQPIANFSSNTVCQGDTTIFSDLSNQGPNPSAPIVSYSWNMGTSGTYQNVAAQASCKTFANYSLVGESACSARNAARLG